MWLLCLWFGYVLGEVILVIVFLVVVLVVVVFVGHFWAVVPFTVLQDRAAQDRTGWDMK